METLTLPRRCCFSINVPHRKLLLLLPNCMSPWVQGNAAISYSPMAATKPSSAPMQNKQTDQQTQPFSLDPHPLMMALSSFAKHLPSDSPDEVLSPALLHSLRSWGHNTEVIVLCLGSCSPQAILSSCGQHCHARQVTGSNEYHEGKPLSKADGETWGVRLHTGWSGKGSLTKPRLNGDLNTVT